MNDTPSEVNGQMVPNITRSDSDPSGNQSIDPLDMVAAAAVEQEEYGTFSFYDILLVGSVVQCVVGGILYQGNVVGIDDDWLYLEIVILYERRLKMLNLRFLEQARTLVPPDENVVYQLEDEELDMDAAANRLRQNLAVNGDMTVEDVSLEGIETFVYMKKMFDNVAWKEKSIMVLDLVTISPPYTIDDVSVDSADSRAEAALTQIRKVMPAIARLVEERRQIMEAQGLSLDGPPPPILDDDF